MRIINILYRHFSSKYFAKIFSINGSLSVNAGVRLFAYLPDKLLILPEISLLEPEHPN